MSADICLASLQMCLLDSEQRNTNGEQMATGSAEEMKWMQRSPSSSTSARKSNAYFPPCSTQCKQHAERLRKERAR